MLQIAGMKAKLAEFKTFRSNYQNMKNLWKYENLQLQLTRDWMRKLERVLGEIAEDTASDAFDLRKFAAKVLEAKPKLVL